MMKLLSWGGDYNITPSDEDVYDPAEWYEKILCSTEERNALRSIIYLGLTDALKAMHPDKKELYTWWDYRAGAFQNNFGLRIDHLPSLPKQQIV